MQTPYTSSSVNSSKSDGQGGDESAFSGATLDQESIIPLINYVGQDAQIVRRAIQDKYGFDCGEQYAKDFIAFVEALTNGQP